MLFIVAIFSHLIGTLGEAYGFSGATEWIVNIVFFTLAAGALSAFVEYLLTNAAKEPIKLFYLQFTGVVTLALYMLLTMIIERMLQG